MTANRTAEIPSQASFIERMFASHTKDELRAKGWLVEEMEAELAREREALIEKIAVALKS